MVFSNRFMRAFIVCALLFVGGVSVAPAAHAQGGGTVALPTGWAGAINATTTPTGVGPMGAAHNFGTTLAQDNVNVDPGAIANTFYARFTPILVLCAIAGAVMLAAKGAVRMMHGAFRRQMK